MRNLADHIEIYLKRLLAREVGRIEIQRNELAQRFSCAPSQINYVLGTRFSSDRGYIVESRRGSGGYVRITRLELPVYRRLLQQVCELTQQGLTEQVANDLVTRLREDGVLTAREDCLMRAVLSAETVNLGLPLCDAIRARLFRAMVAALLSSGAGAARTEAKADAL